MRFPPQNRKLKTGCNVVLRVRADNTLDVAVADKQVAWDKVKPDLKIASLDMCQALLGVFRECLRAAKDLVCAWA